MPVIDAHSHIYPDKIACKASSAVGDFYGVDMNAKNASASSMLAACEGSPITHHLVHSVATTPGQVPIINDFIAEQCRAHDNFVGFATMHQDFEDVEGEINRAIDLGLKGPELCLPPQLDLVVEFSQLQLGRKKLGQTVRRADVCIQN